VRELEFSLEKAFDRGTLDVSSTPWAKVKIDGRLVAESTPLLGYPLPVGPHVVELSNPRLNKTQKRVVQVKKGQRSAVIVRLE
jgi:hypothetical protein